MDLGLRMPLLQCPHPHAHTRRAVDLITKHGATAPPHSPLALFLTYQMTHTPLDPPEEYRRPSHWPQYDTPQRLAFNALAAAMDQGIANVTRALRRSGMWNNTLLIFSADKCVRGCGTG